jgi:hypothetical protein
MVNTARALLVDFYGTLVQDDDDVVARICSDVADELGRPVVATEVARQWSGTFVAECEAAFGPHFRRHREVARSSLETVLQALGSTADAGVLLAAQVGYPQHRARSALARRTRRKRWLLAWPKNVGSCQPRSSDARRRALNRGGLFGPLVATARTFDGGQHSVRPYDCA